MKAKTLLLIAFTLVLCSCYKTMLKLNGIKKPKEETPETVIKKCGQYDHSYCQILCIPKDSLSLRPLIKICKGFPRDIIFNHKGQLIIPGDTGFCAGRAMNFAMNLEKAKEYSINPEYTLSDICNNVTCLGEKINCNAYDFDFTMVIFWANFMGHANKNVFKIMEEMKSSSPLKINYILVNMDIQESWKMSKMPYQDIEIKPKR